MRESLRTEGWPEPIFADSGNGAHLLYRVDLPNDDASRALLGRCLEALAFRFSDDAVSVDLTTSNAARIWKVYGTLAAKGDATPNRPHRLARLLEVPERAEPVPRELLECLAACAPRRPLDVAHGNNRATAAFDLEAWLAQQANRLRVVMAGPWNGGRRWVLNPCPWNPEHTNRAAYVVQFAGGALAAGCHHNGCAGKDWHALRDLVEPGWRVRKRGETPAPPAEPEHLTDLGNAKRLVRQYGENLRSSEAVGWLTWQGHRWEPDRTGAVMRLAKATVLTIYEEAAGILDEETRKRVVGHGVRSEAERRLAAMVKLTESEPGIPVRSEELDRDPMALNVANGVLDLGTGQLRPHRREDLLTKMGPVVYDPDARAPQWTEFLERIFGGDRELIGFVRRAAGYSLTGDTREDVPIR